MDELVSAGLVFDIIGVVVLFGCTVTKNIEAEISYGIWREGLNMGGEWDTGEFEQHQKGLARLFKRVERNRRGARLGLALIVIGFCYQLLANLA